MKTDIEISNQGSIILMRPATDAGRDWISANVDPDAMWFGRSLVVEPRYAEDLIDGMRGDGLEVA